MISFPNAKINLGLNIIEKRSDGYHNISSCFYPVPINDILEIVETAKRTGAHWKLIYQINSISKQAESRFQGTSRKIWL